MNRTVIAGVGLLLGVSAAVAGAQGKLRVVAAENFYGDVARQIGGEHVEVISILSNPNQDPHLFEATPTAIRELAGADVVVFNGADYDPWMSQLLKVAAAGRRTVIAAADLRNKKPGENPHLWYDPATMPVIAAALAEAFSKADPAHAGEYKSRLGTFAASMARIDQRVAEIRSKYAGFAVAATEPVFGEMASALGLQIRDQGFALAAMNNTEPSARQIAAFEGDLKEHKVKVLLYNKQTATRLTQHMLEVARAAQVPVVGVTETEPMQRSYQDWILGELDELEQALAQSAT